MNNPDEIILSNQPGRAKVTRLGDVVYREARPWSKSVIRFLKHLEEEGFDGAPRVIGDGFDDQGREMLQFVDGKIIHPDPWSRDQLIHFAKQLRAFHEASARFVWSEEEVWQAWYFAEMGSSAKIIGHSDLGPWNVVCRNALPHIMIDFEFAGPVDPLYEFAQAAWLCCQFHGDDIAAKVGLPPIEDRAENLRSFAEAYGLDESDRRLLPAIMLDIVVADAAAFAEEMKVTQDTRDAAPLWGCVWRLRSAETIRKNREVLARALS